MGVKQGLQSMEIVTKKGNLPLPKMGHTKDTITKDKYFSSKNFEDGGNGSIYRTRKGKELFGNTLQAFTLFWATFNYKVGKAEAADAWLSLDLNNGLLEEIITAAKKEAERRPSLIAKDKTPKMAQGWLSGRRWEDEIPDPPQRTVAL